MILDDTWEAFDYRIKELKCHSCGKQLCKDDVTWHLTYLKEYELFLCRGCAVDIASGLLNDTKI